MILHPIIDLLKRIVIALPDYAGGGGELPEGMNHTGSGEILFASRTTLNTQIDHGLDFTPKFVEVWTSDYVSATDDLLNCILCRELLSNTGPTKTQRQMMCQKLNTTYDIDSSIYADNSPSFFITDEYFNIGHGAKYYKAATTYYWFAFD